MSKTQNLNDLSEIVAKYGAWFAYVCIGLIGKFGWDIVSKKKLSGWYILGTGCMAAFVGFISSQWFMHNKPDMGPYCVPVLTLVSRDILVFIKLIDWTKILSALFKVDVKKQDK